MVKKSLDVVFDGVNEVPRLEGQSAQQFFGTPPDRTFLDLYSFYFSEPGNTLDANAGFAGSNWTIKYFRMAGDLDTTKATIRDLDNGEERRVETMVLGYDSDVELISTRVYYMFGWDGNKHKVTLGEARDTFAMNLFAKQNIVDTGDTFVGVVRTGGADGDNVTIGAKGAGLVATASGNDTVMTEGYVGLINTSSGNDTVTVKGNAGTVNTGDGKDVVKTGSGFVDYIKTGGENDKVTTGSAFVTTVDTGDGNDVVNLGTGGASLVRTSSGNDKIILSEMEWSSAVSIQAGQDSDTVDFKKFKSGVTFSLNLDGQFQNVAAPGADRNVQASGFVSEIRVENINGSGKNDALTGDNGTNKLSGRGGNDRLAGLEGDDLLIGAKGRDTFVFGAEAGVDRVKGFQTGQDTIEIADHAGGFRALDISRDGKNLEIDHDGGTIVLLGRGGTELSADDFDFV